MQSRDAEFNQILTLTRGILNAQLNRRVVVVFNFAKLALQFRRNLCTTQRGETPHLGCGKDRQNSRYNRNGYADMSEILDKTIIVRVVEEKLCDDRCSSRFHFFFQKIQIGSAALSTRVNLRKSSHTDGKVTPCRRFLNQLDRVLKTIRMRTPIWHSLRRIAAEGEQIFNALEGQPIEYGARFRFGLPHHCQMTHDLQAAPPMDLFHEINSFLARASARPVRDRTKARIEPLDVFDLAKEAFLAFFSLWGKKFDR